MADRRNTGNGNMSGRNAGNRNIENRDMKNTDRRERYEDNRAYDVRREERKRRRRRKQVTAYVMMLVLIGVLGVGGVAGGRLFGDWRELRKQESAKNESKVNELLESEEPLEISEPLPEETQVEETQTQEEKMDEIIDAAIEVMPLEDKVAGLFFVTPESITGVTTAVQAGDGTKTALNQYAVGGIVYFSKNIQSGEQLSKMIENTILFSKYPIFIGVDEEGGNVSRIGGAGLAEKVDSAQNIAATGDAANAYQAGNTIGNYLKKLGFSVDFAPVADLANVENSIMTGRAYGQDGATAIPYVTSMVNGLQETGVSACLKHFPGVGSSAEDTHNGIAVSNRTAEEFRAEEFSVFQAGIEAGAQMVMVGHMAAPGLTGDNTPSSMSQEIVTNILRNELGFDGVIITDAMNMGAISQYYGSDEAAIQALKAGCDMVLMPEDFKTAYNGVLKAVEDGIISEERINDSLRRIYQIKYADKLY